MRPSPPHPQPVLLDPSSIAVRANEAKKRLSRCVMCPRQCGVNRLAGELGYCGTGQRARVASYNLHYGEETPLVGRGGSGTIFFAGCNLGCCFCQNADISFDTSQAPPVSARQLADIMLELQASGAENINLVTPSHVVPQSLEALALAREDGLALPLVYNSSAYDALETLALLEGVVSVYLPDAKFWEQSPAQRLCRAPDYPAIAQAAIREMHRQVGDLQLDAQGVAISGLLVRHLVMPGGLAGTIEWMRFLAGEVSQETYVNIMDQYRPCHDAFLHPDINQSLSPDEFEAALDAAREAGLRRLDGDRAFTMKRLLSLLAAEDKS